MSGWMPSWPAPKADECKRPASCVCLLVLFRTLLACFLAGCGRRINEKPYLDSEATASTRLILPGYSRSLPGHV